MKNRFRHKGNSLITKMKEKSGHFCMSLMAATCLLPALNSSNANAQSFTIQGDTDIQTERFRVSLDRAGMLGVENAAVPEHMIFDAALWVSYSNDPLVFSRRTGNDLDRIGSLVHDRFTGGLTMSVSLLNFIQLGLEIPLVLNQTEDLDGGNDGVLNPLNTLAGSALGDIRLVPKIQLLNQADHAFNLGVSVGLFIPTGDEEGFVTEGTFSVYPELLISKRFGAVKWAANVGYQFKGERTLENLNTNDELTARMALGYRTGATELSVAGHLGTQSDDFFGAIETNHLEAMAGISHDIGHKAVLFGGGGYGLLNGFGIPDFRLFAGLRFGLGFAGDSGKGSNIIRDENYRLVRDGDVAEPVIEEGPNDRDGDGILDGDDSCPDDPEDNDDFEDEDGCPDPDNDQDGVLDVNDDCINVPGKPTNNGCPIADRDNDTVIDRLDNCPDEPGKVEFQGCNTEQFVKIENGKLAILDIVHFKTNKAIILTKSYNLLNNVATVISNHSEIEMVEVEGHTDSRGGDGYNKDLSQRRAESVVTYLVNKGVSRNRLKAIGYGEENPVESNDTTSGRAANRRVEFKILGDVEGIEQRRSGPDSSTIQD